MDVHESFPPHAGFEPNLASGIVATRPATSGRRALTPDELQLTGRGGTSGVIQLDSNRWRNGGRAADASPRRRPCSDRRRHLRRLPADDGTRSPRSIGGSPALREHGAVRPASGRDFQARRAGARTGNDRIARTRFAQVAPALESDERPLMVALQDKGLKRHEWEAQSTTTLAFRSHVQPSPGVGLALSSMGPTMFALLNDPAPFFYAVRKFHTEPIAIASRRRAYRALSSRNSRHGTSPPPLVCRRRPVRGSTQPSLLR